MSGMARALEKIRFLSVRLPDCTPIRRDLMRRHEAKDVLTICELAIQATMERKESGRASPPDRLSRDQSPRWRSRSC